jgi:lipopolysaccharide export system protein LptC
METSTPPETASPVPSVGKRKWVLPVVGLVVILVAVAGIGWFGFRDTGSEEVNDIHATWYEDQSNTYVTYDPDGEWSASLEGTAFDWGTYTFEDGVLTLFNADDSYCAGAVAVWEVAFSDNGDEMNSTFVSDTCNNSVRGQDQVRVRHTP